MLRRDEDGDCWASTGDMTPLFETPSAVGGINWQQIQGATHERLDSGDYTNVTKNLLILLALEIAFCVFSIVQAICTLRFKFKPGRLVT